MKKKCNQCDREFENKNSLEQHKKDKHSGTVQFENKDKTKKKIKKKYIYYALGFIIVIILLYLAFKPEVTYTPLTVDGENVKGSDNATLEIIEYSDFQCPFCASFATGTFKQIEDEYVKTGKVKINFKHFPLPFHEYARKAAEATECAGDQGKFWEMHDSIFLLGENLEENKLKKAAADIGLDSELFNNCLESSAMKIRVDKNLAEGRAAGVDSTPYFIIGNETISGNRDFILFKNAIEKQLR
ncbi:thioredoxin domain-containing protein [Candidatus Woesearchaeota archaeon]|nr:thioredoxin domain-containing protein [Candidatus Woesearchaeota archaeon]